MRSDLALPRTCKIPGLCDFPSPQPKVPRKEGTRAEEGDLETREETQSGTLTTICVKMEGIRSVVKVEVRDLLF